MVSLHASEGDIFPFRLTRPCAIVFQLSHTQYRPKPSWKRSRIRRVAACALGIVLLCCASCGSPTEPTGQLLPAGRWVADGGACLAITEQAADLVAGCGHGRFARPALRSDGSFAIDGTYRIEAGPISIDPAPAAHFSGVFSESTLTLSVIPSNPIPAPPPLKFRLGVPGACAVLCV